MKACRCGRCGTRYEHVAFLALALVDRLDGDALAAHVVHWPDGTKIDVRACARCQTPIARLSPAGDQKGLAPSQAERFEEPRRPVETSRKDG